jgi:hypothetical protein
MRLSASDYIAEATTRQVSVPYWMQAVEEITKEMQAGARDPELCERFFRFLELYYRGGGS